MVVTEKKSKGDEKRKRRRIRLLKRILCGDTNGATIRRATSLDDLRAAYGVTHDTFVDQGYIRPDPSGLRLRPFEALPNTATYVAERDGHIVAITTGVVDSELLGLPADGPFKTEIDRLRRQGRQVGEGTNWLALPDARNCGIFAELIRTSVAYGIMIGCDDVIGAVSPGHAGFYESIGWEIIGSERSYSRDHNDPVVLVRMDLDFETNFPDADTREFLKSWWWGDNPYREEIPEWTRQAEAAFGDPRLLRQLFVEEGQLLQRCSAVQLEGIRRAWGDELFQEVIGRAESNVPQPAQPSPCE
jgi:hypothetical protein